MVILIAPILFIAAVLYVTYPLLGDAPQYEPAGQAPDEIDELLDEKEDLVGSLKDVEMDYRMGKLSLQDYNGMRADFERRIAQTLRRLDELDPENGDER